jgi:hypothetical protein
VFFGSILFKARPVRVPVSSHSSMVWSGGSSFLLYRVMNFAPNATNNSDVSLKKATPTSFQLFDAASNGKMEIEWTSIGDPEVDESESEPELNRL